MLEFIRTFLLLLIGLLSILCVILPPNHFLWQLKIVVSEYPHIPILIALGLLALPGYHRNFWLWPQLILVAEILVLCLYPIVGAWSIGKTLPQELDSTFGKSISKDSPFSIGKLFASAPKTPAFKTLTYFSDKSRKLELDYYPSQSETKSPVIIIIHGWGWGWSWMVWWRWWMGRRKPGANEGF